MSTTDQVEDTVQIVDPTKITDDKDPLSGPSKVPQTFPVAFMMLEKKKMSDNAGCLSAFSIFEDRSSEWLQ